MDHFRQEERQRLRPIMTTTATRDTETLINMLRAAATDLSPGVINALIARPDAVRGALAATGALLARDDAGRSAHDEVETIELVAEPSRSPEEVGRIVDARTIPYALDEEVLSSNEVAARIGLKSRQSVHDWLRKGKIVGWQTAKRGYMFPARQLDERNRPIEGLGDIVTLFEDAYAAWLWLTTPRNALDGEEPLTVLAKGQRDRVIDAAEGHLQGDFA